MDVHKNARLMPKGRELMIERLGRGEPPIDVAGAVGVSVRTLYKWHKPYREEGVRRPFRARSICCDGPTARAAPAVASRPALEVWSAFAGRSDNESYGYLLS